MRSRARQILSGGAVAVALLCAGTGCGSSSHGAGSSAPAGSGHASKPGAGKPAVTLGTKNFTEQLILGQLYAQALRAKGFTINLKSNLGSSEVVDRELTGDRIDGYPEYTGTVLSVLAHDPVRPASAQDAYTRAAAFERKRGVTLLAMAPATDIDVVVTKPAYATQHHLETLFDLRRLGHVTLAAAPEFRTRFNGLIGLRRVYGDTNIRVVPVKIGRQYQLLDDGQVQFATVFTTDGQLSRGGFTMLKDPRNVFGFQNVTFLIRTRTLAQEGPAFAETINAVSHVLSTQALRVMNAAVDLDQQSPAAVARQFLGANGLT